MKRILVIGSGGAGKSTVARKLGQLLDIEVNHLDRFYWRSGGREAPRVAPFDSRSEEVFVRSREMKKMSVQIPVERFKPALLVRRWA